MISDNKERIDRIRKYSKDFLLKDYEELIKPPLFISFKEGKRENIFVEKLEKKLKREGINVLRFDPQKAAGTTLEEIKKSIEQAIIFINIFTLSNFPKNSIPVWPTFEMGIAYAHIKEFDCILVYFDKKITISKKNAKKIGTKSECGKLDENIVRLFTTPKIFDINDEKTHKRVMRKIQLLVNKNSRKWWSTMEEVMIKEPEKLLEYCRNDRLKNLYLKKK